MLRAILGGFLVVLILYGCETMHQGTGDSAPTGYFDVSKVATVQPIDEPRSKQGNMKNYEVFGKRYHVMRSAHGYYKTGVASWYGSKFHGNLTSNGETYDMYTFSAAHKTLPLPTYLKVTNLENGKSLVVRVNDRGPFHDEREIDLSYAAAKKLGFDKKGTAKVKLQAITFVNGVAHIAGSGKQVATTEANTQSQPIYFVQLGAFSTQSAAQALQSKAEGVIKQQVSVSSAKHANQVLHKVQIGPVKGDYALSKVKRLVEKHALGQPLVVER